jgi:hypothetical protein
MLKFQLLYPLTQVITLFGNSFDVLIILKADFSVMFQLNFELFRLFDKLKVRALECLNFIVAMTIVLFGKAQHLFEFCILAHGFLNILP